jgi:hypothetical protein
MAHSLVRIPRRGIFTPAEGGHSSPTCRVKAVEPAVEISSEPTALGRTNERTPMTKLMAAAGLALAIVAGGAAPALAANGDPQRPAGPVAPVTSSVNGGDNGWGNCGHNSSGGVPTPGGNGGYKPSDCMEIIPTDPTVPTDS